MEFTYWKLTKEDIMELFDKQMLSFDQANSLMIQSKARPSPRQFDDNIVRYWLNKSKTIEITSIHFYGGEHFGEPYHWLAEIVSHTDRSHTTKFFNQHGLGPYPVFTY